MKRNFIVTILIAIVGLSMMQDKLPQVKTKAQADLNWEKKVELIGEYKVMMLPMSKRPGSKLMRSSRAEIKLGKFAIALERDKAGIRDSAEVKKFEGKKVKVVGTLYKMVNLWGDGTEQSIISPAIMEVEKIQLAN